MMRSPHLSPGFANLHKRLIGRGSGFLLVLFIITLGLHPAAALPAAALPRAAAAQASDPASLFQLGWSSADFSNTLNVAWGDYDGDGDLDLAAANGGLDNADQPLLRYITLYRNDRGRLTNSAVWKSDTADSSYSVAWGDYDGDGDLDLAVGNNGPDRIYRNAGVAADGLTPQFSIAWSSPIDDYTRSVAWGDYDGDGRLDLAAGNVRQPKRIYHNLGLDADGVTPRLELAWESQESDVTWSLAWGDYDGDGDLDLAAGNGGRNGLVGQNESNRLYRNDAGVLTPASVWQPYYSDATTSLAWSDYDRDGDLDLMVGNWGQSLFLYRTDAGVLGTMPVWSSSNSFNTVSIAWGDYDGDGYPDLAVGNESQPKQVYHNAGGLMPTSVIWQSSEADSTTSVAWGDVDGDGALDLAAGNFAQQIRIYHNTTVLLGDQAIGADLSSSMAWADYDGDGDLDLVVGNGNAVTAPNPNTGGPERLYRNDNGVLSRAPVWESAISDVSTVVTWADYDADGDPDLAVGNWQQPLRIYNNDAGTLARNPVWQSEFQNLITLSMTWADFDGDGRLDLLAGGFPLVSASVSLLLYHNDGLAADGITPIMRPVYYPGLSDSTSGVAWADYDLDGKPDFVAGNLGLNFGSLGQINQLYHNLGALPDGTPVFDRIAVSADADPTWSVAWGDYDGDGDPDLAVGNTGFDRVYRNNTLPANSAATPFTLVWSSTINDDTRSIAWVDYDADGRLDLAVGNLNQPNRLYHNDTAPGAAPAWSLGWEAPESHATMGLAWADLNGDAFPELAVANLGQLSQLYANDHGALTGGSSWIVPDKRNNYSAAWGDVDGDGDLDLAIGHGAFNDAGPVSLPTELYRNDAGTLTLDPIWASSEIGVATSVAWGDVDGDGDLDLAVANGGYANGTGPNNQPERLYRNDRGQLTATAIWTSAISDASYCVAWGDYDGDGDLDLLVANSASEPNRLYRNDQGVLGTTPIWQSAPGSTTSVAWGDYDNDGDLDFAASSDGANQVYRNDGLAGDRVTPQFSLAWSNTEAGTSWSVAWGDVDGDGDLDLAIGSGEGLGLPNRLYRNDHGTLTDQAVWTSDEADLTYHVAWADYDNDGDLDLVSSNGGTFVLQPNRLYRNDHGQLTSHAIWQSVDAGLIPNSAWGDYDNDGDLDFLTASIRQNIGLYPNRRDSRASPGAVPTVHLSRPSGGANVAAPAADGFSTAEILTGTIHIAYTLAHPMSAPVQRVIGQFSLNGGDNWQDALPTSDTKTTDFATSPAGMPYTYTWDLLGNGVMGRSDNVVFRLIAVPDVSSGANQTPGPYLHGAYAATSPAFRVRGTQVHVARDGQPTADAQVYRLPAGHAGGAQPLADTSGQPFHTDALGYLQGRGQLSVGDQLVALQPISSTDTYTIYFTSARPTPSGLALQPVQAAGVQNLAVSGANPLMLFNLDVSLEWDARNDAPYLSQLRFDLQRTSELIYDWTNGQAALGRIRIFHDREHWDTAHIRIYATNSLRPNANQGGILSAPRADPDRPAIAYAPGQVRIGAVWNRYGEANGNLGEDWPRTLAHELGHYALFLDDNYLGLDDLGRLISIPARPQDPPCAGAMSNPYREDYSEFHPSAGWPTDCARTLAQLATGRSDWATIKRFYDRPELQLALSEPAAFDANPGPSSLPLAVTQIAEMPLDRPPDVLGTPIFSLSQAGGRVLSSGGARAFLFRREGDRLLDLGRPSLGQVTARGARPGDRVCAYDLPARRFGCVESLRSTDSQIELVTNASWHPDLLVTPVNSTTMTLEVGGVPGGLSLRARLFPLDGAAGPAIALARQANAYSGAFSLAQPVFDGYIQVWVDEPAPRREIVTDYALGGNPGYRLGRNAPRGSPGYRLGRNAPAASADGQVIVFGDQLNFAAGQFFTIQAATTLPATPPGRAVVGPGYWLRASADAPALHGASIDIGYLGREVSPDAEAGIEMYYWDGASWAPLPTALDAERNEASAPLRDEPGLYALMTSTRLPLAGPGWNLVAYPIRATHPVTEALASINGFYSTVYGYDSHDAADPWKIYDVAAPAWVNDLHALEFGQGYWINATTAITLYLSGGTAAPAVAAAAAASLPIPPATYYGVLPASLPPGPLAVQALVDGSLCGTAQTEQHLVAGVLQATFAINVRAAANGADAGCGAPGRSVTLLFRSAAAEVWRISAPWDNSHAIELRAPGGLTPASLFLPIVQSPRPAR